MDAHLLSGQVRGDVLQDLKLLGVHGNAYLRNAQPHLHPHPCSSALIMDIILKNTITSRQVRSKSDQFLCTSPFKNKKFVGALSINMAMAAAAASEVAMPLGSYHGDKTVCRRHVDEYGAGKRSQAERQYDQLPKCWPECFRPAIRASTRCIAFLVQKLLLFVMYARKHT